MMTRREFGAFGGSFSVVVAVSLAVPLLAGHRSQVGAQQPRHPVSPPATVRPSPPSAPPASPSPSPSSPSAAQQLGADAQRLSSGAGSGQSSAPSPRPSPSPTRAGGCGDVQYVTVSLPVSGLPCGTVRVTRVARVGGTK